jgi:transcriptional regulator with XRE-family HTH domain
MPYVTRRLHPYAVIALEELGTVVRTVREQRGLSQTRLADWSGVSQSTISRLELGQAPGLRAVTLARILAGLEWPIADPFLQPKTPESPAGWQVLIAGFSIRGRFAARIEAERLAVRQRQMDAMAPVWDKLIASLEPPA